MANENDDRCDACKYLAKSRCDLERFLVTRVNPVESDSERAIHRSLLDNIAAHRKTDCRCKESLRAANASLRDRVADLEHELDDEQGRAAAWKHAALYGDRDGTTASYARWLERMCARYYRWQWFYASGIVMLSAVCIALLLRGGR